MSAFKKISAALTGAHTALADLRAEIAVLEDAIHRTEARPPAKADALAKARAEIAAAAEVGEVVLSRGVSAVRVGLEDANYLTSIGNVGDVKGVVALLHGDAMFDAISGLVDERWKDDPGLTAAEREEELIRLHSQKFTLELEEEALIRRSLAAGLRLERRRDVHPAAVLARDEDLPQ